MGLQYLAPLRGAGLFALHNSKYPRRATLERLHWALLPKHMAAFAHLGSEMGAALGGGSGAGLRLIFTI